MSWRALVGGGAIPVEIVLEPGEDFIEECGIALALGVAVLVGVDGVDGGGADRLGDWEVGLSDREVDGVFEGRGESEDSADTRCIDSMRTICDELLDHVNLVFFWMSVEKRFSETRLPADLLLADLGLLEAERTTFVGMLFFVFECGNAFCTLHDIALGGQVAFGLQ